MGTLLDWFRARHEVNIIKETRNHAKKVYDTVFEMNKGFKLFFEGKKEEASQLFKKVNDLEHECDTIRGKIMEDLTKGELVPAVREDLAHLIKRLDLVANSANASIRRLSLLTPDALTPIAEEIMEMSENTLNCVDILHKTIDKQLGESTAKILANILEISKLEHDVDVILFNTKRKLSELNLSEDVYVGLTIFELINLIEDITDYAEETADFIRVINFRL